MKFRIQGTINGETVDVIEPMQPDSGNWEQPRRLGTSGNHKPVFAPYWKYRMGFGRLTVVQYKRWFSMWQSGSEYTVSLPHPDNGQLTNFTCRVGEFNQRLNTVDICQAAANGVDITLESIEVS